MHSTYSIANYLQVPVIKFRSNNDITTYLTGDQSIIQTSTPEKGFFKYIQTSLIKLLQLLSYQ